MLQWYTARITFSEQSKKGFTGYDRSLSPQQFFIDDLIDFVFKKIALRSGGT